MSDKLRVFIIWILGFSLLSIVICVGFLLSLPWIAEIMDFFITLSFGKTGLQMNIDVQWIDAIGSLGAALVALGTVLYFELFRSKLIRPELNVEIQMAPPDCLKSPKSTRPISQTTVENNEEVVVADSYLLRFRVINEGKQMAENIEVFASNLAKLQADGSYKPVSSFLPMHLKWANHTDLFMPMISPGMFRYCDLGHIIDPEKRGAFVGEAGHRPSVTPGQTVLSFDTIDRPYTLSYLQPPGKYQLTILISASNSTPQKRILEINLTGRWFSEEARMLEDGVGIRVI